MHIIESITDSTFSKRQQICVVLGMHRCGTSVLTRGLQALGLSLGDNLMPAMIGDNEKGFWEDLDINAINIRLLELIGSSWHDIAENRPENYSSRKFIELRAEAASLIQAKILHFPFFAFKDPRSSRLLPFWHLVFDCLRIQPVYVIASRNPLSVAISLKTRNKFSIQKGLILWLDYQVCAINFTRDRLRVFVDYDQLLERPHAQLARIANTLGISYNEKCPNVTEYVNTFLDDSQRRVYLHDDLEDSPLDELSVVASKLYYALASNSSADTNYNESEVNDMMLKAHSYLSKNRSLFEYIQFQENQLMDLLHQLTQAEQFSEQSQQLSEQSQQLSEQSQQQSELLRNEVTLLKDSCCLANVNIGRLQTTVDFQVSLLSQYREENSHLADVIAYYQASFSWWITYPMRFMRAFWKRKAAK